MKTIIERVNGRLYIYEESEKLFRAVGHHKREQSVTSQDLTNNCEICDDDFFLVIDGRLYSPKKKTKKNPDLPKFTTKDMKNGDKARIIGVKVYKKNGRVMDNLGVLTGTYSIQFISRK